MAFQPRLLVIDDDPLFRNVVTGLLKNYYAVTAAETGQQGWEQAKARPPHIALIDVQMPGWNGIETLKKFRSTPALAETKIAIITSDASRETVVQAIRNGAEEYIVKTNFTKDDLLKKLRALAAKSALPIDDEPTTPTHANAAPTPGSPATHAAELSPATSVATQSENNPDAKLQDMIDDWE